MPAPLGAGVDSLGELSWQFRRMARASRPPRAKAPASGAWPRAHSIKVSSRRFRVPGTARSRSFPDANGSAFFADGKLKKIAVQSGEPVTLCDAPVDQLSSKFGCAKR